MAWARLNGGKKINGIVKLKDVVEKLFALDFKDPEENGVSESVPEDVKEGHFAVMAVDSGKSKRFIVSLSYLTHPTFLRLLGLAEEEFGFDHGGALTIPCRWNEFEKLLSGR